MSLNRLEHYYIETNLLICIDLENFYQERLKKGKFSIGI